MGVCHSSAIVPQNGAFGTDREKKNSATPTIVSQNSQDNSGHSGLTQNIIKSNHEKDIRDYYDIDHQPVLGSGISGQVKICTHKATKLQYALKSLSKRAVPREKLARMKDEIKCMAMLDHPNILRVHEFFENKDVIYLILELCRGGELLDRLHQQQGHHYSEKVACRYIHTMLTAIAYCHANNVVHRDLKLENFLFENESPSSDLKLIDFGLSQYFKPKEIMHNSVGTPYYVAPEVLEGNYDAKCDVWSIGVIAYMLLSGTPPFYGRSDADTLAAVKLGRWQFDEYLFKPVSAEAKDFITKCLTRRPSARPTAKAALDHKWFQLLRPKQDEDEKPHVSLQIFQRLDSYVRRTSLSKIIMDVVAHTLQPEQIADLRENFNRFDLSHTGEITLGDMRTVLSQFPGFKEEDLALIFKNLDIDQTGKISYHEFLAATITRQNIKEENLQIAFERMSNHGNIITSEDIKDLLGDTKYDVDKIMEEVGLTSESEITFAEFKAIMNGGNAAPLMDSPYRAELRKVAFWKDGEAPGSVRSRGISSHDSNSTFEYAYGHDVRSTAGGNTIAGSNVGNSENSAHFVFGSPGGSNRSGRAGLAVGYPGALGGSPPGTRNKALLPIALLNASVSSPNAGSAYNMHNATISPRTGSAAKITSPATSPATPPAASGATTTTSNTGAAIASGIRAAEDIGASSLEEMDIL